MLSGVCSATLALRTPMLRSLGASVLGRSGLRTTSRRVFCSVTFALSRSGTWPFGCHSFACPRWCPADADLAAQAVRTQARYVLQRFAFCRSTLPCARRSRRSWRSWRMALSIFIFFFFFLSLFFFSSFIHSCIDLPPTHSPARSFIHVTLTSIDCSIARLLDCLID